MNEKQKIIEALVKVSEMDDGKHKIPCVVALQIANEFGVMPSEIGKICDDENIKIVECQLGCFA